MTSLLLLMFAFVPASRPCLTDSYRVHVSASETHVVPGQRIIVRYEILNAGSKPFYAPRSFPPWVLTPRMQIFWTDLKTARSEQMPMVHVAFPGVAPKLRIADHDGILVDPDSFVGRDFAVFAPRKPGHYRLEIDPWSWECSDISTQQLEHPALAGRLQANSVELVVEEMKTK